MRFTTAVLATQAYRRREALQFTGDLTEFYLFGTAGDVIDIMIFD